eukprot:CAMPEP_0184686644 /NCGR_PEP_ID=MMETSP0312-20130426/23398_1 /TAXON_ID=31354 /ORGANISM="Compsopogon coeruleus, Strain SAG 36.94" /LENGTH=331 /DNA_ID=CAMNT_0027141965 /DNA_START=12 /DNA_END=1007 /DNA_ORIENTATION=+
MIIAWCYGSGPWVFPSGFRERRCLSWQSRKLNLTLMAVRVNPMDEAVRWIEAHLDEGKARRSEAAGASGWASMGKVEMDSGKRFFVKTSGRPAEAMFLGEAEGLRAMHATRTITVPNAYHVADTDNGSYIIMDYLDMRGRCDAALLGRRLAEMHLAQPSAAEARSGQFGFPVKNTIGGTPQPNPWTDNWVDFFREHRLGFQLRLARDTTLSELGKKLMRKLDQYFVDIDIQPAILHGDLWSGNMGVLDSGEPVIFDPASYYGHHEAEFGMSWCAGFGSDFHQAYHDIIPRAPGFEDRHRIYQLYHYLNHYNLFGGGYYNSALSILQSLTNE